MLTFAAWLRGCVAASGRSRVEVQMGLSSHASERERAARRSLKLKLDPGPGCGWRASSRVRTWSRAMGLNCDDAGRPRGATVCHVGPNASRQWCSRIDQITRRRR
jgi:hypothetical protein